MCGLVGVLSRTEPVEREVLDRAVARIQHRGPDGQKTWIAPDRSVGLAHARLAIIDLVTGAQPLHNETDDIHAVVNGEIYDHDRIRSELAARGHTLRTASDSEVLIHLYEELGVHCLRELRGELAFVLWDAKRRWLFAARDRFGIKPLYYADTGRMLALASEAKALFAAGVPARWDQDAFFDHLVCQMPMAAEATVFQGVAQIPPAHYLLATPQGTVIRPYWTPSRVEAPSLEELGALLEESVKLRLRADVPVGVYLSGGVDSSTILGLAKQHPDLRAFTITFDEKQLDELAVAKNSAAAMGVPHVPLFADRETLGDRFADAVEHSEHPHDNPHGAAKMMLSRLVRAEGVKVVLTGEGADEIFLGYPWLILDLLKHDAPSAEPASVVSAMGPRAAQMVQGIEAISRFAARHPWIQKIKRSLGYLPSLLALSAASFLRPEILAMGRVPRRVDPIDRLLASLDGRVFERGERARQSAYLQMRTYFASYNLNVLGDRMEMANGVEGRTPYLDHRFVEAVLALPAAACFRDGQDKHPLRTLAEGRVTAEVLARPKFQFMAHDAMNDRGRLGQLIRDVLDSPSLESVTLYDRAAVKTALEKTSSMPAVQSGLACMVASAFFLGERFRLTA